MAKKFIAGNLKCKKCKASARWSMYRTSGGDRVCRSCALAILGAKNEMQKEM